MILETKTMASDKGVDGKIVSNSPEETERLGVDFAADLEPGTVVAFFGDLGSGKTTFIRGVCRGLNVTDRVSSPSFTVINEYSGRLPVYHFDFYRIVSTDELWELGWEEYFYGQGVCLIEWADHVADFLPERRIEVHMRHLSQNEDQREITVLR